MIDKDCIMHLLLFHFTKLPLTYLGKPIVSYWQSSPNTTDLQHCQSLMFLICSFLIDLILLSLSSSSSFAQLLTPRPLTYHNSKSAYKAWERRQGTLVYVGVASFNTVNEFTAPAIVLRERYSSPSYNNIIFTDTSNLKSTILCGLDKFCSCVQTIAYLPAIHTK